MFYEPLVYKRALHIISCTKKLDTHAKIWTRTQKYGHARKNIDTRAKILTHAQKYGHACKNMDTQIFKVHKNSRYAKIGGIKILKVQKYSMYGILSNFIEYKTG